MKSMITPKDVIVHKVGSFLKLSNGMRPGALKPGRD